MNFYDIWFDLADSSRDLEFAQDLGAYLGALQKDGLIEGYVLARRKFGFSPPGLGDFHVRIVCRDLTQLDQAFSAAARRTDPLEGLHRNVFSAVRNFRSGLYREFPDPVRGQP
jgi:hypothetical protein